MGVQRLPGRSEEVAAYAKGLPGPVRATYEAVHRVAVPSVEEGALRDLVRAREDLRGDRPRALEDYREAAAP